MTAIDNVLGMDWSDAKYIGDGVYLRDAEDYLGFPAVAVRTDRGPIHQVTVFDTSVFNAFVNEGTQVLQSRGKTHKERDMTTPKDGGPAFPRSGYFLNNDYFANPEEGMSRRDWFAGQAMNGLVGGMTGVEVITMAPSDVARWAYEIADAMLEVGDQQPEADHA